MEDNHLKSFLSRVMWFVALYMATSYFFWDLSRYLPNTEARVLNLLILFSGISLVLISVVVAKTFIHMHHSSMDEKEIVFGYCRMRLLFSLATLFFFLAVFSWVVFLGGVLNSAMASLLTTVPAFFIFGMSDRYWVMLDENYSLANRTGRTVLVASERMTRGFCYAVYFATVLNFDLLHVLPFKALEALRNFSLGFVSANSTTVTSSNEYLLFALLVFLGSVAATVQPFLQATRK